MPHTSTQARMPHTHIHSVTLVYVSRFDFEHMSQQVFLSTCLVACMLFSLFIECMCRESLSTFKETVDGIKFAKSVHVLTPYAD